jgi:hypothetical protein
MNCRLLIAQAPAPQMPPSQAVILLLVGWVGMGIVATAFYLLSRNATLKRRLMVPIAVISAIYFLAFVYTVGAPQFVFYFIVPAVFVISILNILSTKFCDGCGRTLYRQPILRPMSYCPYCGAKLQESTSRARE